MCTFTRAAAEEFTTRVQRHFNTTTKFSWVGTIHALAYRLLGRPALSEAHLHEFGAEVKAGGPGGITTSPVASPQAGPYWWGQQPIRGQVLTFRARHGQAQHRCVPITASELDHPEELYIPLDRLEFLAEQYAAWKQRNRYLDFEDLLVQGQHSPLPVDVLLCDEMQDASALLWEVTERWAERCTAAIWAADPGQSVFSWVGADPHLFVHRVQRKMGQLVPLGHSRRLTPDAATYAQRLLQFAGHRELESLLATWRGVGDPETPEDDTVFYLARTRELLLPIQAELTAEGVPWADFSGYSYLTSKDGRAFLTFARLRDGGTVTTTDYQHAVERVRTLPLRAPTLAPGVERIHREAAERHLGYPIEEVIGHLRHGAYFETIYRRSGLAGLVAPPRTFVGTIHASKGRECGVTYLETAWGYLPADAQATPLGRRSEGCVAYVAASRHRHALILREGGRGRRYPFPAA